MKIRILFYQVIIFLAGFVVAINISAIATPSPAYTPMAWKVWLGLSLFCAYCLLSWIELRRKGKSK